MKKKSEKNIIKNINNLNLKCEKLKHSYFHVQREIDYLEYETIIEIKKDINDLYKKIISTNYSVIMLSLAFILHILSHLLG